MTTMKILNSVKNTRRATEKKKGEIQNRASKRCNAKRKNESMSLKKKRNSHKTRGLKCWTASK